MPDRPALVLLPAMPCGADSYEAQTAALADIVDPIVIVREESTMTEAPPPCSQPPCHAFSSQGRPTEDVLRSRSPSTGLGRRLNR